MSTIVTRAGKGSALTFAEGDANFTNLNTDKIESVQQDTAPSLGGALDVNGFGIVNTTGSGDIVLNSDTVMLGLGQDPEGVVITTQGAVDLVLDTNDGIDTGEIRIETGASGNIVLEPTGTGKIVLAGLEWPGDPDSEPGSTGGGNIVQVASGTVTSISNNRVFLNNFAGIGVGPVYDQQIQFTGSQVTQLGLNEQQMYFIVDADATNDSIEISEISNFSPPVQLTDNSSVTDVAFAVFEIEATAGTNQPPTQYSGTVLAIDDARQPNTLTLSDSQQLPGQLQGATVVFTGTDTTAVGLQENFAYNIQAFFEGDKIEINEGAGALGNLNAGLGGPYDINYTITEGQAPSGPGSTGTITEGSVLTYVTGTLQWQLPQSGGGTFTLNQDPNPQLGGNLDVNNNSIVSQNDGNIVLAPAGNGKTVANRLNYNEAIHDLGTVSGTVAPDVNVGNVQTITLNGNLTFNEFTNPQTGQSVTLIINTGGTDRTLSSTMRFAGGDKTLSTTNTTDIISVFFDGTNYFASLSTDFN